MSDLKQVAASWAMGRRGSRTTLKHCGGQLDLTVGLYHSVSPYSGNVNRPDSAVICAQIKPTNWPLASRLINKMHQKLHQRQTPQGRSIRTLELSTGEGPHARVIFRNNRQVWTKKWRSKVGAHLKFLVYKPHTIISKKKNIESPFFGNKIDKTSSRRWRRYEDVNRVCNTTAFRTVISNRICCPFPVRARDLNRPGRLKLKWNSFFLYTYAPCLWYCTVV